VLVTRDAQRTMATYLGACVELGPDDVDEAEIAGARFVYLEGYLWDRPGAKAACLKAAELAHRHGRQVALTLSDPFCVNRWRAEFADLIARHVDVLIANEAEICSLYGASELQDAAERVRREVRVAALTRSADGSLLVTPERSYPDRGGGDPARGRHHGRGRPVRRGPALWARARSAAARLRAAWQPRGRGGARPLRRPRQAAARAAGRRRARIAAASALGRAGPPGIS
jgi:hypothetical protein